MDWLWFDDPFIHVFFLVYDTAARCPRNTFFLFAGSKSPSKSPQLGADSALDTTTCKTRHYCKTKPLRHINKFCVMS